MGEMMTVISEPVDEREFYQACAESVKQSLEDERLLRTRIGELLAELTAESAEAAESGGGAGAPAGGRTEAVRILLDQERADIARVTNKLTGLLEQQLQALGTFNIVLFGRTGAGKSSLVEALTDGNGARVSAFGESDWTKDVSGTEWHGCQVFDTPGIGGWDTSVRPEQMKLARLAVASADVVVLCFDTQNQRAAEFKKVAKWIAIYDKAAIAVLNVRNEKWRIPDLLPDPAARRACSVHVAQHVQHLRGELAQIGLNRTPVIALHARNAMFACAREPYLGPAPKTRATRLDQLGRKGLHQCSNVHVLERLLMTAIRQGATSLRMGSVNKLVAGAAQEAGQQTAKLAGGYEELATVHEASIARAVDILGLPEPAAGNEDYAQFMDSLAMLGKLRDSTFQAPRTARAQRYGSNLISAKLAALEASAQARADTFIEEAIQRRRALKPGAFESAVFPPGALNAAVEEALSQFQEYLARHFKLIARSARADLRRVATGDLRLRTSAGRTLKAIGVGSSIGGIGSGPAGMAFAGAIALSAWTPVGWTAFGVAGAAAAAGLVLDRCGVSWRRQAASRKERALGEARAQGREVVHETFRSLAETLEAEFDALRRRALADNLAEPIVQAMTLRRITQAGIRRTGTLRQFQNQVAAVAQAPQDLMTQAVKEYETRQGVSDRAGQRRLWLGESWLGDHASSSHAAEKPTPARPDVGDEIERFAAGQGNRPPAGSGARWLNTVSRELAYDPFAAATFTDLRRLGDSAHPRVVVCGDYDGGKSSLIARLHRETGCPIPENLTISAAPTGPATTEHGWEGLTLVDTPGFQVGPNGLAEETILEIASAAAVLLVFTPGLALGDKTDLIRTLYGDSTYGLPGKAAYTLLVINRADELGADPETGEEFAALCAHKSAELRESLAIPGHRPLVSHVVCVAADPYGVGQAHPWDGMAEFAQALKAARQQFEKNARDVTILAGGMARIGALTRQLAQDLPPLQERANELHALEQDVGAMVAEAEELNQERRAALKRDVSRLIHELISRMLTERNSDKHRAIVGRLESLGEDAQVQKITEAWSRETRRKVAALEQAVAHRIGRRLGARERKMAAPELNLSGYTRVLKRGTAGAIGAGIAQLSGPLQKLERFTAGAASASRLERFVQFGGPALTVAGVGYSTWSLFRELRGDADRERKRNETIQAIQGQASDWVERIAAHDSALARLAELTGLLREVQAGASEECQVADVAESELTARMARYQLLADQAATLLGINKEGTP
jgi:predicted GTPase